MVDDTQNYWVFGLFPLCRILGNRRHEVSENGSVSVFLSHLKQIQFPKRRVFYYLKFRTTEKVENPSNSV
jgi:hypothetical protein